MGPSVATSLHYLTFSLIFSYSIYQLFFSVLLLYISVNIPIATDLITQGFCCCCLAFVGFFFLQTWPLKALAGLQLTMQLNMTLNLWSSCTPSTQVCMQQTYVVLVTGCRALECQASTQPAKLFPRPQNRHLQVVRSILRALTLFLSKWPCFLAAFCTSIKCSAID